MDRDRRDDHVGDEGERAVAPHAAGKSPRTARLSSGRASGARPVQAKVEPSAASPWGDASLDPFGVHLQEEGGGGGDRMPATVQRQMESSFAADFSGVRIHQGPEAAAMGALAYAQGSEVHFAPGQYQPHTQAGQELLGHELGHVVQQAEGRVAAPAQAKGAAVNEDAALEREADEMGARAARGEPARGGGAIVAGGAGAVVQAKYTASAKQKTELKGLVGKWGAEYMDGGGTVEDLVKELADYFDSHDQAKTVIGRATYSQWNDASLAGTAAAAFADSLIGSADDEGARPKAPKKKDPIAEVKKRLTAKGMDLTLFKKEDLEAIDRDKETDGWETAIATTFQRVNEAKQNAEKRTKLIQDYANAKAAGDLIFTGGLLAAVWNLSYQIAISPVANVNTTVAGEYADGVILAAVPGWRGQGDLEKVTQFHVPGGPTYIEDKSTRPVNPDLTRGRQCDFISYWGGNKINVHVDSDVHH
jgi:Domain of unknown function (DUF4157)